MILFLIFSCRKDKSVPEKAALPNQKGFVSLTQAAEIAKLPKVLDYVFGKTVHGRDGVVLRDTIPIKYNNQPVMYAFNYANDTGFVIISADLREFPVLAHSDSYFFECGQDSLNAGLVQWLELRGKRIEMLRDSFELPLYQVVQAWLQFDAGGVLTEGMGDCQPTCPNYPCCLIYQLPCDIGECHFSGDPNGTGTNPNNNNDCWQIGNYVLPLMDNQPSMGPMRWKQYSPYNADCPSVGLCDGGAGCARRYAGCVAIALGQVTNFWDFPLLPFGSNGQLVFPPDWAEVPNTLSTSTPCVSTPTSKWVRNCANLAAMNWFCHYSFSTITNAKSALETMHYSQDIDNCDYVPSKVVDNLDLGRPVIFGGTTTTTAVGIKFPSAQNAHAWVCDGYRKINYVCSGISGPPPPQFGQLSCLDLHMNWGWGGYLNGYFAYNNITVDGSTYDTFMHIIVNIHP